MQEWKDIGVGRCRGLCLTKFKPKQKFGQARYTTGQKLCGNDCEGRFVSWDGQWCPCCGYRLRNTRIKQKAPMGKYQCATCGIRTSTRGTIVLWFKDENGKKQCHDCYIENNKLECEVCNVKITHEKGKRKVVITTEKKIMCSFCYNRITYSKTTRIATAIRKGMQNLFEEPILITICQK